MKYIDVLHKRAGWLSDLLHPENKYVIAYDKRKAYPLYELQDIDHDRETAIRGAELKIDAKTLARLNRLLKRFQKNVTRDGWLPAEDAKRDLYIHTIRRHKLNNKISPELYLDVRDKSDPRYYLSDAMDHDIVYFPQEKQIDIDG